MPLWHYLIIMENKRKSSQKSLMTYSSFPFFLFTFPIRFSLSFCTSIVCTVFSSLLVLKHISTVWWIGCRREMEKYIVFVWSFQPLAENAGALEELSISTVHLEHSRSSLTCPLTWTGRGYPGFPGFPGPIPLQITVGKQFD